MIAQVVEYYDDNTPQSWKVALLNGDYLVKVLQVKSIDENTEELVIYGPDKEVMRFYNDSVSPYGRFKSLAAMAESIDKHDYQKWLYNEIYYYEQLAIQQECEDNGMPFGVESYGLDPLSNC